MKIREDYKMEECPYCGKPVDFGVLDCPCCGSNLEDWWYDDR